MAVDTGCVSSGQTYEFPGPGLRKTQVPMPRLELNDFAPKYLFWQETFTSFMLWGCGCYWPGEWEDSH